MRRTSSVLISICLCSCGYDTSSHEVDAGFTTGDIGMSGEGASDCLDASLDVSDSPDMSAPDEPNTLQESGISTKTHPDCNVDSCALDAVPRDFDHETCREFECHDVLAVCINGGEDAVFDLQSTLTSIGKFVCSDSNTSACIASGVECEGAICCVLDQPGSVGTFEAHFYDAVCSSPELIRGVGCLEGE